MVKVMSAEDLYREEILEVRAMRPADRLLEGARLFDRSCEVMPAGIRAECPGATEAEARRMLDERLDLLQRLQEAR